MPYKIAIASGKGGTGKTTVSVNLFLRLRESMGGEIQLVDCDVEEPNDIIFFPDAEKTDEKEVFQFIPSINTDKCTYCRKCADYCEFNAISIIPSVKFAQVNNSLCHSCGACLVACNFGAITEHPQSIGKINFYETPKVKGLVEGKLKVGSAMQTMVIKELKKSIYSDNDIVIYDAPPGTSCPVVETISDANYVILVAEPTLFGVHDLKLMVNLIKELDISFGVIINKAGLGSNTIYEFLKQEKIELLGEIPFSKAYASLYAEGNISENVPENIVQSYAEILTSIKRKIVQDEGDNYFKW